MGGTAALETRRRSVVKSLTWRVIGVVWTWVGAYFIILLVPDSRRNAVWIATFIVVYHHSTRMIMFYFSERIWTSVGWGRVAGGSGCVPMTLREKIVWALAIIITLVIIFGAIVCLGATLKAK